MTTTTIRLTGTALCLSLVFAGCAATSGGSAPPAEATARPSGTLGENLVSTTATVKAIDQKTRQVTLERADGSVVKFRAGDQVRNLAQVKVGDVVRADYYESLAFEVRKPGEGAPGTSVADVAARAELGEKPGAATGRVTTITATIAAIDKTAMTVTLRSPDGELTTVKARNPDNLNRVVVGDLVDITYTEALAISVEAPGTK
jgi:Cu/Ag efflux protein CusF